ncbi:MAG: YbdD/YjiX family protein [Gammaproteobacteria bacterium]|nr:YbdD/YjiX family protein [Gammaproteobacteria bacterium]
MNTNVGWDLSHHPQGRWRAQSFSLALTPSVSRLLASVQECASRAWSFLRQLTGDDAYEAYLEHLRHDHAGATPLPRGDYFRQRLDQRWRGVTRCC